MAYVNKCLKYIKLAPKDNVPNDYYSITDILSINKFHEPVKKINEMRRNTLTNVLAEMDKENTTSITRWWYSHINDPEIEMPYGSDVIWFMKNSYIALVVKLIEPFVETQKRQKKGQEVNLHYVSFGIKSEYFDRYFRSKGKDVPVVPKRNRTTLQKGEGCQYDKFHIDGNSRGTKANIPRVPEYQRWKDWCKLNEIKQTDAIIVALHNQVEENPTEELPPLDKYTKETVTLVQDKEKNTDCGFSWIERNEYNLMREIIRKYNKVETRDIKGAMTNKRYTTMAIAMLNNIMAKEYLYKNEMESVEEEIKKIDKQAEILKQKL